MNNLRFALLVCCLAPWSQLVSAQQPAPPQPPISSSTTVTENLTESLRKTVAFIAVVYQDGTQQKAAIGTCFFVSVADKRLPEGRSFSYLVTNRHVAQPGIDLDLPFPSTKVFVRLNLKEPQGDMQSEQIEVPMGNVRRWYFPQDPAVDIAVLPLGFDEKKIDFISISSDLLVTSEMVKSGDVVVGDHVTFAGYFSNFPGQKRMEPIVRQGLIAMIPDETLDTTLHKPGHLYLADLHAFHGNSGSPVYVNVYATAHHGTIPLGEKYLLLGLISGYYPESVGFSVPAAMVLTGEVRDNSGIATIVPAYELNKLLNSTEIQTQRDNELPFVTKKP